MAASTFFLQNCATITNGSFQKIPVTSDPPGAKILVNGDVKGSTPLNLRLKKLKSHVIRIEKEGYNPLEIRIQRKGTSKGGLAVLGDIISGGVLGYLIFSAAYSSDDPHGNLFLPLFFWGFSLIGCVALDYAGGGLYELSPAELQVTLTESENHAITNLIILNVQQLNKMRWIRIKCQYNKEEKRTD